MTGNITLDEDLLRVSIEMEEDDDSQVITVIMIWELGGEFDHKVDREAPVLTVIRERFPDLGKVTYGGEEIEDGTFDDWGIESGARLHVLIKLYPESLEEAQELSVNRLGFKWGGTGNYTIKGCYIYPSESPTKYAGTAWWGTGGDSDAESAPLTFRPTYAMLGVLRSKVGDFDGFPATEDEAKKLAALLGFKWGGTGNYYNKGCYIYPHESATKFAGTAWWGTGGDSEARRGPLTFRPTYAMTY